jgi:hypothetical protein
MPAPVVRDAIRRTFYIEKRHGRYELVKVWEAGTKADPMDMQRFAMERRDIEADERIFAEQVLCIERKGGKLRVIGDELQVKGAERVAEYIIQGDKEPS